MDIRVTVFERKPFKKLTSKQQEEVKRLFEAVPEDILKKSLFTLYHGLDPKVQQGEKPWQRHSEC